MGTPSHEQVLAGIKRLILEEKRDMLCKYMNPERYIDYLRSKFILNEEDKEEIEYEKTRRKRASKMIDILLRKGDEAYERFVQAIQMDRTQTELVKILHTEYEKRKNNYFALVAPRKTTINTIDDIDGRSLPKPAPPVPVPETDPLSNEENGPEAAVNGEGMREEKETVYYNREPLTGTERPASSIEKRMETWSPGDHKECRTVRITSSNRTAATGSLLNSTPRQHDVVNTNGATYATPGLVIIDTDSTNDKERKEQANLRRMNFISRSTDQSDDQETYLKQVITTFDERDENKEVITSSGEGEENTEVEEKDGEEKDSNK